VVNLLLGKEVEEFLKKFLTTDIMGVLFSPLHLLTLCSTGRPPVLHLLPVLLQ
jgi:hypothetical protein